MLTDFAQLSTTLSSSPLTALAAVFLGGVLTSLTPCLYPTIPITVAIVGGGSAQASRSRRMALAFVYVFGLAAAYAALGLVAGLGVAYLFAFSFGMCSLLLVIAFATDSAVRLPRAGPWTPYVKKGFALLLLGVAEYYLISMGEPLA